MNMKRAVTLLMGLLLGPCSSQADELLKRGAELVQQGKQTEAIGLFRDSADSGDPSGDYALGVMYFEGTGVPKDMQKSTRHFRKAAQRGHVLAQYNLGNAYVHSRGVPRDLDQAEKWWREAATRGYARAQFNLGALLYNDSTLPALREEGIAWYRAAAQGGFFKAAEKLEELDEPLNYADIGADAGRQPLRDEAYLMTLPADSYLIHLFSGSLTSSADRFIQGNQLNGLALRFRFPHRNGIWTGVVHGGWYEDAKEARSMVDKLKKSLRDAGPWVRPVREVQNHILSARKSGRQGSAKQ